MIAPDGYSGRDAGLRRLDAATLRKIYTELPNVLEGSRLLSQFEDDDARVLHYTAM